jgi:UDP-N-acetylmuramoyl-tripeptide--D-alanyl-D-alanine ligase
VLGLRAEHACAVIEIGMNHPGETQYLANITRPTIAVINNAQREHQEFMASVDQVAEEHAAAIRALPDNGIAVLNRDDPYFDYWSGVAGKRSVRDFGIGMLAGLRAAYRLGPTTSDIEFAGGAGRVQVTLQIPGLHNICNALAAAAAALAAGVSTDAVARGLASFRAVKGRTQFKSGRNGVSVIDDTYNANPDSVRAAVDVLAASAAPRVLILGDMGEVGSQGTAFHDELGRYAAERGIDSLLTVGALAHTAAKSFGPGGEHFASVEALIARAQTLTSRKGTMLVKGSRFMRMERVVVHLLAGESEAQCC